MLKDCCVGLFKRKNSNEKAPLINADVEKNVDKTVEIKELLTKFEEVGKAVLNHAPPSVKKQIAALIPGTAVNVGLYLGFTLLMPEFAFAGAVAGNAGALVHAISTKATGVNGAKGWPGFMSSTTLVLKAGPVSEGIRGALEGLLKNSNPILAKSLTTALPAIAQAVLADQLVNRQELKQLHDQLTTIVGKLDVLKDKVSNFDEIVREHFQDAEQVNSLYGMIKKNA